jgi:hypothetical protein
VPRCPREPDDREPELPRSLLVRARLQAFRMHERTRREEKRAIVSYDLIVTDDPV